MVAAGGIAEQQTGWGGNGECTDDNGPCHYVREHPAKVSGGKGCLEDTISRVFDLWRFYYPIYLPFESDEFVAYTVFYQMKGSPAQTNELIVR